MKLTEKERRNFWRQYQRLENLDRLKPCEYGHFDCSVKEGGPCMNEQSPAPSEEDDSQWATS